MGRAPGSGPGCRVFRARRHEDYLAETYVGI